jgi:hypothetical protein
LGIDLPGPLMEGNREFNRVVGGEATGAAGTANILAAKSAEGKEFSAVSVPSDTQPGVGARNQLLPENVAVDDFFTDRAGVDQAVKVAKALSPRKALQAAVDEAGERVDKQVTKTQNSLRKANERAALVSDKLRSGDVEGAVKQVGANVQNRVDRLKKDIDNGASKLRGEKKEKSDDKRGAA